MLENSGGFQNMGLIHPSCPDGRQTPAHTVVPKGFRALKGKSDSVRKSFGSLTAWLTEPKISHKKYLGTVVMEASVLIACTAGQGLFLYINTFQCAASH